MARSPCVDLCTEVPIGLRQRLHDADAAIRDALVVEGEDAVRADEDIVNAVADFERLIQETA